MKKLDLLMNAVTKSVLRSWIVASLILATSAAQAGGECAALAGTLTANMATECLVPDGTVISATPADDAIVPDGFQTIYVLTEGADLVIQNTSDIPEFTVMAMGTYTIHTLVYDPLTLDLGAIQIGVTTGVDVDALLLQGGGDICASLDVAGASVVVTDPDAGGLTPANAAACLDDGEAILAAIPDGDSYVPDGFQVSYLLTSGEELIYQMMSEVPAFTVNAYGAYTMHTLVYHPATFDVSMLTAGVTTGLDIHAMLVQGGGSICASLDAGGAQFFVIDCTPGECDAYAGGLTTSMPQLCLANGMATLSATLDGTQVVPEGYEVVHGITKAGTGLVIEQIGPMPQFTVTEPGEYTMHTLVYDPNTLDLSGIIPGVTTAVEITASILPLGDICAALDVPGVTFNVTECEPGDECLAWHGSLASIKYVFCYSPGGSVIGATVVGDAIVPPGSVAKWLVTHGEDHVITNIGDMAWFVVDGMGEYHIHTLVYDPMMLDVSMIDLGTTTLSELNSWLIQGGGDICGSLDLDGVALVVDDPTPPTLTATSGTVCLMDGMATVSASAGDDMYLPMGYTYVYVLTMGEELLVKQTSMTPSFDVMEAGHYTIHTFIYDPETFPLETVVPGVSTGYDLNAMLVQGGGIYCAALDVTGASVHVMDCEDECLAWHGSLESIKYVFCYSEGGSVIGATVVGDAMVPAGYEVKYVATHGDDGVIVAIGDNAWFVVDGMGEYTIHTLVYDPATLDLSMVELGVTTAAQVNAMLIQGGGEICASLDLEGVALAVDDPATPTLTATSTTVCLEGGSASVSATAGDDMYLPMGYSYIHVLTMGDELLVMQTSMTPSFEVMAAGDYTIHTFVYDPATFPLETVVPGVSTGFDLNAMLVQGGGIYCAALDVAGANVEVIECEPSECLAFAGTLVPHDFETCIDDGSVVITAEGNDDMIVPAGYLVKYVLTTGDPAVIVDVADELSFTVTAAGTYTFHTLVYHPATLDLSTVELGVTTAASVNALLIQGGGSICASLDLVGGTTLVVDCTVDCPAYAGSLTTTMAEVCLEEGSAMLDAVSGDDAVVPEGYEVIYVLTEGGSLTIMDVNTDPMFMVTMEGNYTIHTLVYDPLTLDLSIVVPGVTLASEVNALLIQGGGAICASLDLVGANIMVMDCSVECLAFAGTISTELPEQCLLDGMAMLEAIPGGDAVLPDGYEIAYVLTHGLTPVILEISTTPSFTVADVGLYTIHTLVYDPLTLDLSTVVPGVTLAMDVVAMLIQGGGSVCASLDLEGAAFFVGECELELEITNAWPVPALEQLTVSMAVPAGENVSIAVFNAMGLQVTPAYAVGAGTEQMVLNVSGLESGTYVVRLIGTNGIATHQFSKLD